MTKKEKIKFINQLINNVKKEIIACTNKMPMKWNGYELRQYIADRFNECSYKNMGIIRKKEYDNTILIENL